jgi:hypothetical protein
MIQLKASSISLLMCLHEWLCIHYLSIIRGKEEGGEAEGYTYFSLPSVALE